MRICLYSADNYGLGHINRLWKFAQHLKAHLNTADFLFISSSNAFWHMVKPEEYIDVLKLPQQISIHEPSGVKKHVPRFLKTVSSQELGQLRATVILSAVRFFRPDVFIVDYSLSGTDGELLYVLKYLKNLASPPQIIASYRDIIGNPHYTREFLRRHNIVEMIKQYYDRVIIFGDPLLLDSFQEYGLPDSVTEKIIWYGYLVEKIPNQPASKDVLVTVGSGIDGFSIIQKILTIIEQQHFPYNWHIILGPDMPQDHKQMLLNMKRPKLVQFHDHVYPLSSRIAQYRYCISMAGYNTTCEAVSTDASILLVPRCKAQKEQHLRAEAFAKAGLVEYLPMDKLDKDGIKHFFSTSPNLVYREKFRHRQEQQTHKMLQQILMGVSNH